MRSAGIEPVRLHQSGDEEHLLGGWTRYNAAGDPILANRITYMLTRAGGSGGLQARFGAGFLAGSDDEETAAMPTR